jgi:putative transposase
MTVGQFATPLFYSPFQHRQFVSWGAGKETIWREVKSQSIPGEDDFVEGLISHIKKHQDVPEIPKSHRYVNRPVLEKIFTEKIIANKRKRDTKIVDAVQKYGYTRQQIAAHVNMYYSTISNLVRGKA